MLKKLLHLSIAGLFIFVTTSCAEKLANIASNDKKLDRHLGEGPFDDDHVPIDDHDHDGNPGTSYVISKILHENTVATPADVLWVIDNSGSMKTHQVDVQNNTTAFINQFSKIPNLNWKMGLISSDVSVNANNNNGLPYAGFATPLDSTTPNGAQVFIDAVGKLGILGSGTEKFYEPVKKHLTDYPNFKRPGALFDLIIVTDTDDQSSLTTDAFKTWLSGQIGGMDKIKLFGVFGPKAWGCPETDMAWDWFASKFLALTQAFSSQTYKLCDPNFGQQLVALGNDLVLHSSDTSIVLLQTPIEGTLFVQYNHIPLVPGKDYTYDSATNTVRFPNLDFARDQSIPVMVYYSAK